MRLELRLDRGQGAESPKEQNAKGWSWGCVCRKTEKAIRFHMTII
jgi:hypothetical protein